MLLETEKYYIQIKLILTCVDRSNGGLTSFLVCRNPENENDIDFPSAYLTNSCQPIDILYNILWDYCRIGKEWIIPTSLNCFAENDKLVLPYRVLIPEKTPAHLNNWVTADKFRDHPDLQKIVNDVIWRPI